MDGSGKKFTFREGDLVDYRFNATEKIMGEPELKNGLVLSKVNEDGFEKISVKWKQMMRNHYASDLEVISEAENGDPFEISASEASFDGPQNDVPDPYKGCNMNIYANNTKSPLSQNASDILKWLIIVFCCACGFVLVFLFATNCNKNMLQNDAQVEKAKINALDNCIKVTSKPLECRETFSKLKEK